jgi:hypothetical protein
LLSQNTSLEDCTLIQPFPLLVDSGCSFRCFPDGLLTPLSQRPLTSPRSPGCGICTLDPFPLSEA